MADSTLVVTLLVILWGAFVRATGSGAGCGNHWPMCNGEVIPRGASTQTLIELTHRLTSGVALLLVVALFVVARRAWPRGHVGRRAAALTLFLMVTEALIGAGLVLFEKVAHDQSLARGAWMTAHLLNTLMLLAAMAVTCWACRRPDEGRWSWRGRAGLLLGTALASFLLVGVSGAIAALGDTLFPAKTLAEGLLADRSPSAHLFVQLRVLHPFVAVATSVHLVIVAATFGRSSDVATGRLASYVGFGAVLQVAVGVVNLLLAAPVFMQIVHLLVADLLWLALVWLTASALSRQELADAVEAPRADARTA